MLSNPTLDLMRSERWRASDMTPEEKGGRKELIEVISRILNLAERKVSHTPTVLCCHHDYKHHDNNKVVRKFVAQMGKRLE